MGAVVEEMTSTIIGGTCLVRILFEDGSQRTFNNDLDSDMCCYLFGIRRDQLPERNFGTFAENVPPPRRRLARRTRYVSG